MSCERCQQATIELALIKIEIDAWQASDAEGFGQITAPMRMKRIASRFEAFQLIAHPRNDTDPPQLELRFPDGHEWRLPRDFIDVELPVRAQASPEQRSSLRTFFEVRTSGWVKWVVMPVAWVLSLLVAWWVLH